MRRILGPRPTLTNVSTRAFNEAVVTPSSVVTAVSRWRTVLLCAAVLATFACCGLMRPPAASAACNPETVEVFFNVPEHSTRNFKKEADGCAQPWLSYLETAGHIKTWVKFGGTWHNIKTTACPEGAHTCNLAPNWGTACEGTSCNGREFHLQWEEGLTFENEATLNF